LRRIKMGINNIIGALLIIGLLSPIIVSANTNTLPSPGMLPDHPLYGLKIAYENIIILVTPEPEAKIRRLLDYADKRAAETKRLMGSEKEDLLLQVSRAEVRRQSLISQALRTTSRIDDDARALEILGQIEERQGVHIIVLESIRDELPEAARGGIDLAIQAGQSEVAREQANRRPQ
jgi:parvulin-like peptidyl-prolyl isomerase